jgi:hypothetical protein
LGPHACEFETQRPDQDASGHVVVVVVAAVEEAVAVIEWYNQLMDLPEPEPIDPNELRPGPIQHQSLSDELLEQVQSIYEHVGLYLDMMLVQFEIGFMRDMHAESEVLVWAGTTKGATKCD